MKPRFKIKRVNDLLDAFHLDRDLRDHAANSKQWLALFNARASLWLIAGRGLEQWSRSYCKLHGRPAVVDQYLIEHNAEIREALQEIEQRVNDLWRPWYEDDPAMAAAFDRAWAALDDLWALDLLEDEQQEIERTAHPKLPGRVLELSPVVVAEQLPTTPLPDAGELIDALTAWLEG